MHRISYIEIQNFRACQSVSLPLDVFTPLVGQNNVGKSTILDALKWLLKPDARSSSDFSDAKEPIVVTARVEGISPAILALIPEPKPFSHGFSLLMRFRSPLMACQKTKTEFALPIHGCSWRLMLREKHWRPLFTRFSKHTESGCGRRELSNLSSARLVKVRTQSLRRKNRSAQKTARRLLPSSRQ